MSSSDLETLAQALDGLGQPLRFQLLLIIADGQACVCHFEQILGLRQAKISQHLMHLRRAGLVLTSREGRHIYYRLSNPLLYPALRQLALVLGMSEEQLEFLRSVQPNSLACRRILAQSSLSPACLAGDDSTHS
jgi:ArsR family transcriptional regulator